MGRFWELVGTISDNRQELGLADLVQQLSAAQQAFDDAFQSKVIADAKQNPVGLRAAKDQVSYYIGKLLHYIDFQAQTDPSYSQAVSELNEAIANVMAKAHARQTRSQDANVTPAPAPAQTASSAPSAKVVQLEPKAEVQAKAA